MLRSSVFRSLRFESLPIGERPSAGRLLALAGALVLLAVILFRWDWQLAQWAAGESLPGDLRRILTWSEAFAHGAGIALIGLAALWLDPPRRCFWPRILLTAYGAGLLANVVKLFVTRIRPSALLSNKFDAPLNGSWLPSLSLVAEGDLHGHVIQSFPSGHVATAVGFACALWSVYPRGRMLWVILAALAGLQRMQVAAHYASDVLIGAAVGCLAAVLLGAARIGAAELRE
jgi:membrane-associated phospholipid phosphatase